eukprot:TRINITY_DN50928_c0_g1_i1.p1 TRINITY_DN50928_c0_g1~~TRINITY_DN50928_c0_g1_i1.p1  ORF type:complete len:341 (+),score=74.96 TRINITY_DN50928_c0_g1_i1:81-1103(+)
MASSAELPAADSAAGSAGGPARAADAINIRVTFSGVASAVGQDHAPHGAARLTEADKELVATLKREQVTSIPMPTSWRRAPGACARLKAAVRAAPGVAAVLRELQRRRIPVRLNVVAGGGLIPDSATLAQLRDGDTVHCVFVPMQDGGHREPALTDSSPGSSGDRPRGFDRLSEMGFSPEDIHAMRDQFAASQSAVVVGVDQLLALEDEWLDGEGWPGGTGSGARAGDAAEGDSEHREGAPQAVSSSGNGVTVIVDDRHTSGGNLSFSLRQKDMVIGTLVGFFLGVLSLLMLCLGGFSLRHRGVQLGIVVGVVVNLCFSAMASLPRVGSPGEVQDLRQLT